jgi:hypothetical protein
MKKFLEITTENEKALVLVCDAAMKSQGLSIYNSIKQLLESVKEKEE